MPTVIDPLAHPLPTTPTSPTTPTTPPALPIAQNETLESTSINAARFSYDSAFRSRDDASAVTIETNVTSPPEGEAMPYPDGRPDAPPSYGDVDTVVVEMVPDMRRERTTSLLPTYDEAMASDRC